MLKHIYRAIILVAVFIASLFYFSRDIKEVVFRIDSTTQMSNTTFPVVTLKSQDSIINLLHGYAATMDSSQMRESITPIDSSQNLFLYIDEKESTVKKVNYELRNTFDNKLLESGSYSALEKSGTQKIAKLKFTSELEQGKEYALTLTTVTAESKKINYYTRIMLQPSMYVAEKLAYVTDIHNALLSKDTAESVSQYFESSKTAENTNLGQVDIHSSMDLLSYGSLPPEIVSEVIPTIKEISADIASIEFNYFIKGTTEDGEELFYVNEFYRVKYTPSRMYLLNYNRSMQAQFDITKFKHKEGLIKLGVSSGEAAELYLSEGATSVCFVRNGELWLYNLDENRAVRIFSFQQKNGDYIRDRYDQHDIQVVRMNVEGTIDFVVMGYMNRGNYEGRVGMILYRYFPSDTRIQELIYVPVDVPYQILKENVGSFSYMTYNDVYYFVLNQAIYCYNITTKNLVQLAGNMTEDSYIFSKEAGYIAWEEHEDDGTSKKIIVMDLETQATKTIEAEKNSYIHLLGKIDNNMIYGLVKEKDVYTAPNGEVVRPCYKIEIASASKEVKKTYQKSGHYVTSLEVKDNVIHLKRLKKSEQGFVKAKDDHILNQSVVVEPPMKVVGKDSEQMLREYYIDVTKGKEIEKKPKTASTVNTIITDETTLRLEESNKSEAYYVYAYGKIIGKYATAGEAVRVADTMVGVVVNQNQQIVWARGTRNSKVLLEVTPVLAQNGVSTMEACIQMLGEVTKGKQYTVSDIFRSDYLRIVSNQIKATMVNLTGASLEQIQYYINKGRPVIGIGETGSATLLIGYDGISFTVLDPKSGRKNKMTVKVAEKFFDEAGNVFLSFIE